MVKITNQFGDVKTGKQHTVVYQGHYGNQTRRMLKDKKDEHTRGQLEQRERFKTGIDFAKNLTKAQRDFIKTYMAEAGIRSPDGLPTTWYTFAKKIAMTRPEVEIETEGASGFSGTYAAWSYRKPISLNNQSGGELTNYQVLITLTTDNIDYSHFNNDGSDVRFTNNTGVVLSYWIEDWNYGGTSKVWVKVDSIPTGDNLCCYIYYGNSNATNASNGDNTFDFFDDFPGVVLNTEKWEYSGTITVSDSIVSLNGDDHIIAKQKFGIGYGVYAKSKADEQDTIFVGLEETMANQNNRHVIENNDSTHPNQFNKYLLKSAKAGSHGSVNADEWNDFRNTYYTYRIKRISTAKVIFEQDTNTHTYTDSDHIPTVNLGAALQVWDSSQASTLMCDWVIIKKTVATEPTSILGDEETGSGEILLKSFKIRHPAIKSYEIKDTGVKEESLSNLEDHISTVVTRKNLDLAATKIKVVTLANQEYEFIVK